MYLRFTTPGVVTRAGIAPGPFSMANNLAWRHEQEPLGVALIEEIRWFNRNLPVPRGRAFAVRSKGRWFDDGVCWFRDDAREMIAHAWVLAALIEDCGVPVERCWTDHPGQILYRDPWQVVAKPDFCWRRCPTDLPAGAGALFPQPQPQQEAIMARKTDPETLPSFRADLETA